jgi:hypothetical protein
MTQVWVDDQLHAHPKARAAWEEPRALGLHLLAMSYSGGLLTDGFVDEQFVREKIPRSGERARVTRALVSAGLWEAVDGGWRIHDWLEHQESRAKVLDRRRRDRDRKRDRTSTPSPDGFQTESERIPGDASRARPRVRGEGRVKGGSGVEDVDARAPGLAHTIESIVTVLGTAPRLFVDRVAVENMVAAWPKCDHVAAAHEAAAWAQDPAWRKTNGAGVLGDALSRQQQRATAAPSRPRGAQRGMDQAQNFMTMAEQAERGAA